MVPMAPLSTRPAPDPLLSSAVRYIWSDKAFTATAKLVDDCLERAPLVTFAAQHHRLPVIKVLPSSAQTSGAADPLILEKLVESALINSGRARVIAAADLTSARRGGPLVLKVSGRSLVPDFLLTVHVAATARAANDPGSVVVLTTVQLVHLQSNEVVWMKVHRTRQRIG